MKITLNGMIPESLRNAYLAAIYRFGDGPWLLELHPGQHCAALQRWMNDSGWRCAAVLTAFNPRGERVSPQFNSDAQRRLARDVEARGLPSLAGQNLDPAGIWPEENSLLVGNLDLAAARGLARQFGQLAFLWTDSSAVPGLYAADLD